MMFGKMKTMLALTLTGMMVFGTAAAVSADVNVNEAKKAALEAAGVTEDQVIFKTEGQELDDGRQVYDIDFFIPGEKKFEFDVDASTGAIIEQSVDVWEADDDFEYASLIEKAGKVGAASGAELAVSGELTEQMAKDIVLKETGFSEDAVTFTKCVKDVDDGITKFEIEIRTSDGMEYDYEVNAADGTILEMDVDEADFFD